MDLIASAVVAHTKKAGPGGLASSIFRETDDHLFLLFDTAERDTVVQSIYDAHDGRIATGGRATLAAHLEEQVLPCVEAYVGRLYEQPGHGYEAPEYHALISFVAVLSRVAETLRSGEGRLIDGTVSLQLGVDLHAAWTRFMGDAAARFVGAAFVRREAQDRVKAESLSSGPKAAAEANVAKAEGSREAVRAALGKLQPSQQGRSATALIVRALEKTKTPLKADQVLKHLKAIRDEAASKPD